MLPIFLLWGSAAQFNHRRHRIYYHYFASAFASRNAHRLVRFAGSEEPQPHAVEIHAVIYAALIPLLFFEYYYAAIICFILLSLAQNFWYPYCSAGLDAFATEEKGATVLSIESRQNRFQP